MSRYYLDYNSTSPLSLSVIDWLARGDFLFANSSSSHFSGQQVKKRAFEVREFLFSTFKLSSNKSEFNLVFHSGATEGINTFFQTFTQQYPKGTVAYFKSDHPSVVKQKKKDILL